MRQSGLIKEISHRLNLPEYHCRRVIETMEDVVTECLANGEDVSLRGFCTFEVTNRKPRKGYNPLTGEYEEFEAVKSARCKLSIPVKKAAKTGIYEGRESYDE